MEGLLPEASRAYPWMRGYRQYLVTALALSDRVWQKQTTILMAGRLDVESTTSLPVDSMTFRLSNNHILSI